MRTILIGLFIFISGFLVGGYFFSDSQSRKLLDVDECLSCFSESELIGLVASVGIQKASFLLPNVVFESDKTIVLDFSEYIELLDLGLPQYKNRYIFVPKKDIKSLSTYTEEDQAFILDLHATVVEVLENEDIKHYKFYTSGPDRQHVTYLHYHLAF